MSLRLNLSVLAAALFTLSCAHQAPPPDESAQTVDGIRGVVKSHTNDLHDCYMKYLAKYPKWHGKIVMEWQINDEGKTTDLVVANNSAPSDEMGKCLTEKIQAWKFAPAPKQTFANVKFPFVFAQDHKTE
jgi:TonB family protein